MVVGPIVVRGGRRKMVRFAIDTERCFVVPTILVVVTWSKLFREEQAVGAVGIRAAVGIDQFQNYPAPAPARPISRSDDRRCGLLMCCRFIRFRDHHAGGVYERD